MFSSQNVLIYYLHSCKTNNVNVCKWQTMQLHSLIKRSCQVILIILIKGYLTIHYIIAHEAMPEYMSATLAEINVCFIHQFCHKVPIKMNWATCLQRSFSIQRGQGLRFHFLASGSKASDKIVVCLLIGDWAQLCTTLYSDLVTDLSGIDDIITPVAYLWLSECVFLQRLYQLNVFERRIRSSERRY